MKCSRVLVVFTALLAASLLYGGGSLYAVPSILNHQGYLTDASGQALTGAYSLTFSIYTTPTGGTALWSEPHPSVTVTNGLFSVQLGSITPFPTGIWDNPELYLGVQVGTDPELAPRSRLVSSPFSMKSGEVDNFSSGPGNVVTGQYGFAAGDSNSVLTDMSSVASGHDNVVEVLYFADTIPDTSPSPGGSQPSEVLLRSPMHAVYSAFIGGGWNNHAHGMFSGVLEGWKNETDAPLSWIGSGFSNYISNCAPLAGIGGGYKNSTWEAASFIGGGAFNRISADPCQYRASVIGGGILNFADYDFVTIGGGYGNSAVSYSSTIGGGMYNKAELGSYETIGGGFFNHTDNDMSTISGGDSSYATHWATVGGGHRNKASNEFAVVSGGRQNEATLYASTVGGGEKNIVSGADATIGGGGTNNIKGDSSVIAGGHFNNIDAQTAAIGGGSTNNILASGTQGTIAGGVQNQIRGPQGAIGGGTNNIIGPGGNATIPGGWQNRAAGGHAFAAGTQAHASDSCSFVWADCCEDPGLGPVPLHSTGPNSFTVRATGGFYFLTSCDTMVALPPPTGQTGVYVPAGGGAWLNASSRDLKRIRRQAKQTEILEMVSQLPVYRWSYKSQDPSVEHIGPLAEDFYRIFKVGDNQWSISSIDPAGIALAAIKELNRKEQELEAKTEELESLKARLNATESRLEELASTVARLAAASSADAGADKLSLLTPEDK